MKQSKWLNIFNKHGNKSTLKYRKELTPNIKFQPDKIFVRNDLFEQVIKSCKSTNIEFTMLQEKLGICLYAENYYEEKNIKIQDEKPIEVISKVSTKKSTKKLTKELIKKSDNESNTESDNKSVNESDNKSVNKGTTDWYDKNKFNEILTTIDNNNFNHKNKIGKLKFNDINNLINNIKNSTISEADTKKKINELNEIKKAEIKGRQLITSQKILLSLFDDLLKTILNNTNNNSNGNNNKNESENKNVNDNDNKIVNEDNNVNDDDDYDGDDDHDEQYYEINK